MHQLDEQGAPHLVAGRQVVVDRRTKTPTPGILEALDGTLQGRRIADGRPMKLLRAGGDIAGNLASSVSPASAGAGAVVIRWAGSFPVSSDPGVAGVARRRRSRVLPALACRNSFQDSVRARSRQSHLMVGDGPSRTPFFAGLRGFGRILRAAQIYPLRGRQAGIRYSEPGHAAAAAAVLGRRARFPAISR